MSSLDHDHLQHEGQEPRTGTGSPLAPASGTRSRRRPAEKVSTSAPARRPGKARSTALRRPAGAPAGAKAAVGKATGAARTAVALTRAVRETAGSAAAGKAALAESPAPPAARPRPTPHRRTSQPAIGTAAEDAAAPTAAAESGSRTAVEELVPAAEVAAPGAGRRSTSVLRRRSTLYVAAALVGAIGVGAVVTGPAAQADPADHHRSMSVAAQLGISSPQAPVAPDAHDADRLAELSASRATREAEQSAAEQAQQQADAAAAAAIAEAQRPKAVLPVTGARLTSTFGYRWGTLHAGIDLAAPIGTPEYAAADGVVLEAGPASGFGLAVYIQHANGDVTVYGHMEQILVQAGQVVRAGDQIALLGNNGQSTGPHLHLEVHIGGLDGEKVDPIPWLQERGVQVP